MSCHLLNIPREILEIIGFYVIGLPWKQNSDVKDMLSFTSTCQELRYLVNDERYWKILAMRRDPSGRKPSEFDRWFDYCKQILNLRTIPSSDLVEKVSHYNEDYHCTVEQVRFWHNRVEIDIDERGDMSLGPIQNPSSSRLAIHRNKHELHEPNRGMRATDTKFSIADSASRYLGTLIYPMKISCGQIGKQLLFTFGESGYSEITLFVLNNEFFVKHHIL